MNDYLRKGDVMDKEKVFETKREYCTSVFWTAVFGDYECKGWRLREIKSGGTLDGEEFKAMSKDIEELLIMLNKKAGRPKGKNKK